MLVFNEKCKVKTTVFKLGNDIIEPVNSYKYLGVVFSQSGIFNEAQSEYYKKGLKAYFKLKKISGGFMQCRHTVPPF